jgi:hypothetical protein
LQRLNAGKQFADGSMTLQDFFERIYVPYIQEKRASTRKGYEEVWRNHIGDRVGHLRLREFRTVHASKMLKAIANDSELSKTTLQLSDPIASKTFTDGILPPLPTSLPSGGV